MFFHQRLPFLSDSQFLRHNSGNGVERFRVDLCFFGDWILIVDSGFEGVDPMLFISVVEHSCILSSLETHDRDDGGHPPIFVHELRESALLPVKGDAIGGDIIVDIRGVSEMGGSVQIKEVSLTGILEFGLVLVLVDISVLSLEGVSLFELVGGLLADSIGLSGEGTDSNVGVEGFTAVYEF